MKSAVIAALGVTFLMFLFLGIQMIYPCKGGGMDCTPMMGHGGGMEHEGETMGGGHDMGSHSTHQHQNQPLNEDQARYLLENHIKSKNDPTLSLGEIYEGQDYFEANILTKDGALVDKVRVAKDSGLMESVLSTGTTKKQESTHQGHVH